MPLAVVTQMVLPQREDGIPGRHISLLAAIAATSRTEAAGRAVLYVLISIFAGMATAAYFAVARRL